MAERKSKVGVRNGGNQASAASAKNADSMDSGSMKESRQENGKASGKGRGFFSSDIPVYLAILFLVLGLVVGYALRTITEPQAVPGNGGIVQDDKTVKVELVYSDDCGFCRKSNTIIDVFDAKEIPDEMEEVEASTPRGIQLIADFGITSVPSALVGQKGLEFYSTEKKAMDESFVLKDGKYVVPEVNLDQRQVYAKMYLDANECSTGSPLIELFDDPYSETSITLTNVINESVKSLGPDANLNYHYIEGRQNSIPDDVPFRLESMPGIYLRCAAEQGRFPEFNEAFKGEYCNHAGIEPEATQDELETCNLSSHFGVGFSSEALDKIAKRVCMDMNKLEECKPVAEASLKESAERAIALKVTRVPSAVVACTYFVPVDKIREAFCKVDASAC